MQRAKTAVADTKTCQRDAASQVATCRDRKAEADGPGGKPRVKRFADRAG